MTPCPNCQKPVDPLRSRHVGVQDGKVVAFCSAACEAAALGRKPRTPAQGVPVAPARVPISTRVPQTVADLDSGPVIEILHEPASGVVTSARDERTAEDGEAAPAAAPAAASGKHARSSEGKDSASVAGELKSDSTIRKRRMKQDSLDAKAAWEWLDDEPAELGPSAGEPRRGRGGVIALLVLLVLAGGGVAGYYYVYLPRVAESPRTRPGADARVVAAPDAPVAPTLAEQKLDALERARDVLRAHLKSESPRVKMLAAAALARTGDAESIAMLGSALATEKDNASQRLAYAYQLARAGDQRGSDALVAALGSSKRDDKLDAAMRLAQLGDARAVPVLTTYLEVSQHRLSVLEVLARYPDPSHTVEKALRQIRVDDKASADEKARATIALGVAGHAEVVPDLRALLPDKGHNPHAAAALALLHDAAARPVLADQLRSIGLRVEAARMLRKLEPELDPTPLLPGLFADLEQLKAKDTELIPVAEAILLLVGPPSWSEKM